MAWANRLPRRAGLVLGFAAAAAGCLWLQRDPHRCSPDDPDAILSPADGKILTIEHGSSPGWVDSPAWRIVIYLSLLDVHVQRAPAGGRIELSESHCGGYRPAFMPQATANASHALGLENPHGRILVVRSAGIIARRVITNVQVGDELSAGQRIGRILLGSRTEVYLPGTVIVCARTGDRVAGGETILARWRID